MVSANNKSMKIVIPYSQGRISPVFDVAEHFYLIEVENGREFSRQRLRFAESGLYAKMQMLSQLNVDVVICGAISGIQENILRNTGIRLITFICGDLEDVLEAFIHGNLTAGAFGMPGYCGKHRRRRYGYRSGKHNQN